VQPAIVLPIHDPDRLILPRLDAVTPILKELYARAFVGISPATFQAQPTIVDQFKTDEFFQILFYQDPSTMSDHLKVLYEWAAFSSTESRMLHLCFPDRVVFALQSEYRDRFFADIQALSAEVKPLIFQRSPKAWETHPHNYRDLEQMVTKTGELLFGRTLDFAWCHLVVPARRLQIILPNIKSSDLSLVAELVLPLIDEIQTREVDWLAWEDPFILGREATELKAEREQSLAETRKRLDYVIPMLALLNEAARRS
jgi:hypothetical protein